MTSTVAQPGSLPAPSRLRRSLHNLFIVGLLFLLLQDGLPCAYDGHKRVKDFLDPVVDVLGIWQGSWKLFAPNPDHMNTQVEAKVTFSDGSTWSWKTPNWRARSQLQKFEQGRHPKFWDAFRLDSRKGVWPYIARYAASIAPRPSSDAEPVEVELIRHWWKVPAPKDRAAELEKFGALPPPQDQFPNHFTYHTEKLRRARGAR